MNVTQQPIDIDLFFKAAFSIDLALLTYQNGQLKIALEEKNEPRFNGQPGLPGMLIYPNEDTRQAVRLLSREHIGITDFYRKQLRAFTEVSRHPQGRVVTIAYYGLVPYEVIEPVNDKLYWTSTSDIPDLMSYDHHKIAEVAIEKFKTEMLQEPLVFEVLPERFILSEVIDVYEQVFNIKLDAANFRRQLKQSNLIDATGTKREQHHQMGRKPEEFTFNKARYQEHAQRTRIGFNFSI